MSMSLWIIAIVFTVMENCYFGWNATPQSTDELMADGLAFVLFALAIIGTKVQA